MYVGVYEVTHREWRQAMGRAPTFWPENKSAELNTHPVTRVSWTEIQALLKKTGLRLLTSAEWEYVCRAGTTGPRYGRLNEIAVSALPGPVGTKKPNKFGLYDMIGNLWEWCSDAVQSTDGDTSCAGTTPARSRIAASALLAPLSRKLAAAGCPSQRRHP